MAVTVVILALTPFLFTKQLTTADLDGEILKLMADIKSQQIQSMIGVTSGTSSPQSYGIKIATTTYILFRGSSYNPADTSNFTVSFPSTIQLQSFTMSSTTMIFSRLTGEVAGYISGQDSFTFVNNLSNDTRTLTVQRFGNIIRTP